MRALLVPKGSPKPSRWKNFSWQCKILKSIISTGSPSPFVSYSRLERGHKSRQEEFPELTLPGEVGIFGLTCWTSLSPFDIFSVYTKELNILCKRNQKGCVRGCFVINVTAEQLPNVDGWGNGVRAGPGLSQCQVSQRESCHRVGICMERLIWKAKNNRVLFFQTSVYLPNWHKVLKIVPRASCDPFFAKHLTQDNHF